MTTRFYPTYKCRFCEKEFVDGHTYDRAEDATFSARNLRKWHPIHYCDGGHIGIADFVGFERIDIGD